MSQLEGLKQDLNPYFSADEANDNLNDYDLVTASHPQLLFLDEPIVSMDKLISSLPSRPIVNNLLNVFLLQNGLLPLISVMLHVPTFLEEVERFWQTPQNVDLNWLSIVYSIMCLALQAEMRAGRKVDGVLLMEATCTMFSRKAALCLRTADYARPCKYTVEAMVRARIGICPSL